MLRLASYLIVLELGFVDTCSFVNQSHFGGSGDGFRVPEKWDIGSMVGSSRYSDNRGPDKRGCTVVLNQF